MLDFYNYVKNHGEPQATILNLTDLQLSLFDLPNKKARISKLNSPHFLGYNGFS